MLPRIDALVTPASPVAPVTPLQPAGEAAQEVFQRSLQTLVGQSLQGQVLSQYRDGSYLVRVAGNAARMQLPAGVQVGAEVSLTLLAAEPRPVFQFGGDNAQGGQAALVYAQPAPGRTPAGGQDALLPSQENNTPPGATPRPPAGANPAGQPALPGGAAAAATPATLPGAAAATTPGAVPGGGLPGAATTLPTGAAPAGTTPAGAGSLALPAGATPPPATAPAATPAALATANASASATLLAAGLPAPAAAAARPAGSLAAILLGRAPLTPAAELPELDAGTAPATLSPTARVLTSVLGTANSVGGAPAGLVGRAALVASGAPLPEQLAQTLRDTITNSGLFYESHVVEWVKGQRTLPELMREPQMLRLAQGAEAARAANAGPDLAAAQMINQQLHSHEQARVQWQGEAWPGQPMQWHIQREQREPQQQSGGQEDGAAPEQVWRSGVRFRFPLLGQVEASVTLVGGQIQIQVQTANEESAATLRAYADRLESAMAAAGSPLSSLTIRGGDQHDG